MNKNSKIYIAGHRGLVGSAIVKNLESRGYTNLVYKTHAELDLTNQQAVANFFESEKPEYVILAAAKVGGIVANNTYRADFIYENLAIQNNVIHQSYVHGVKKLLFLGSTCIYPKNAPQPMPEDCLLTSPLEYTNEPYAIAKIAGIKMCESYNIQYGTNFISVMPTNLYGPNDNFDLKKSHVLPALIRKIHLGKCLEENNWDAIKQDLDKNPIEGIDGYSSQELIIEKLNKYGITFSILNSQFSIGSNSVSIEIWGTGNPRREFLYSEDMADACVFLLENRDFQDVIANKVKQSTNESCTPNQVKTTEIRNTHINIGTGEDLSIKDLAIKVARAAGFEGEIIWDASKPDGTPRKVLDVSKIMNLGWKPSITLDEGISQTVQWYQENK